MPPNDPTILVKKADGTFVRMTLAELEDFKKTTNLRNNTKVRNTKDDNNRYKYTNGTNGTNDTNPEYSGRKLDTKDESKAKKQETNDVRTNEKYESTKITKDKKTDGVRGTGYGVRDAWIRDDAKSPLEEKLDAPNATAPKISNGRDEMVDEVIKKLNFPIPPNVMPMFRRAIRMRLKDIRGEDEIRDILLKSVKDGGAGLTKNQAEMCFSVIARSDGGATRQSHEDVVPTKFAGLKSEGLLRPLWRPRNDTENLPMIEPDELPQVYVEPPTPANSMPHNVFVRRGGVSPTLQNVPPAMAGGETPPLQQQKQDAPLRLRAAPVIRPTMHDITAPPIEMGPVEEIKYMTLTDFRRLSDSPAESARRLGQKLITLQEESFLLFLDALQAYRQSPLYVEYVLAVCTALNQHKSLALACGDKKNIQIDEIMALVEMEQKI